MKNTVSFGSKEQAENSFMAISEIKAIYKTLLENQDSPQMVNYLVHRLGAITDVLSPLQQAIYNSTSGFNYAPYNVVKKETGVDNV